MYFGDKGERYPLAIYKRLSKEDKLRFIEVDDTIMETLLNEANSTNSDIVVGNDGQPTLQAREVLEIDTTQAEISTLKSYLNKSNYIAINYGACRTDAKKEEFLIDISDTYGITNEEVLYSREQAVDKINELQLTLNE